jgi:hypothetical protein
MYRITEHDEYLLSLLLDNDLPAEQAAALRRRLDEEPELRACFDALARVNSAVTSRREDVPGVNLDAFHANLMRTIAASGKITDADEFLLSRQLDRDLTDREEQSLRHRLDAEPALRERLCSLRRVDTALARKREDQPTVDYGRFHRKVMKRIEAEAASLGRTIRFPFWARIAVPLAAAAAVLLVVWLGPSPLQPTRPDAGTPLAAGPARGNSSSPDEVVEVAMVGPAQPVQELVELVALREPEPAAAPRDDDAASAEGGPAIEVSYQRSPELAEAIEKVDNEQANQPARKLMFFASADRPASVKSGGAEGDFLEISPM